MKAMFLFLCVSSTAVLAGSENYRCWVQTRNYNDPWTKPLELATISFDRNQTLTRRWSTDGVPWAGRNRPMPSVEFFADGDGWLGFEIATSSTDQTNTWVPLGKTASLWRTLSDSVGRTTSAIKFFCGPVQPEPVLPKLAVRYDCWFSNGFFNAPFEFFGQNVMTTNYYWDVSARDSSSSLTPSPHIFDSGAIENPQNGDNHVVCGPVASEKNVFCSVTNPRKNSSGRISGYVTPFASVTPGGAGFRLFGDNGDEMSSISCKATPVPNAIYSVAGNGKSFLNGEPLPARESGMTPINVAADRSGNLYFVDAGNGRVRKAMVSTGLIHGVANDLVLPEGSQSRTGIAVDRENNVYFSEYLRVKKVNTTTGVVSSVAGKGTNFRLVGIPKYGPSGDGGPATEADFGKIAGIAVDDSLNLYIADPEHSNIRKVRWDGVISTVAGSFNSNGSINSGSGGDGGPAVEAQLLGPTAVTVDREGNLYIADTGNHRIRKVTAATGVISTVAGSSGPGGFSGDGSLAINAKLNGPEGVAVDADGNIYIMDTQNARIRKVTVSDGIISTIAGGTPSTLNYREGDVPPGDGGPALAAWLTSPKGLIVDSLGRVIFADVGTRRIRVVNPY